MDYFLTFLFMINKGYTSIRFASPEKIRQWAERNRSGYRFVGKVINSETLQYRTHKPVPGGLFCEVIFGPMIKNDCWCGFLGKNQQKGKTKSLSYCPHCLVENTNPRVRRYRLGIIELNTPVVHPWLLKSVPNYLTLLLEIKKEELLEFVYCSHSRHFSGFIPSFDLKKNRNQFQINIEKEMGLTFQQNQVCHVGTNVIEYLLSNFKLEEKYHRLRTRIDYKLEIVSKVYGKVNPLQSPGLHSVSLNLCKAARVGRKRGFSKFLVELRKDMRLQKLMEALLRGPTNPQRFLLEVIPVLPPDLRPILRLPNGVFAVSDLNTLYRKIIIRNNRYQYFARNLVGEPMKLERHLLQEAVDELMYHKSNVSSFNQKRPLKSLAHTLRGKQGRFRQNLLGKRVDYSGRSVIVVGPSLKLNQCGLPREMVLELFQPFIISRLIGSTKLAKSVRQAKLILYRPSTRFWSLMQSYILEHPILLNRAPTLHRLGIQAFEPKVVAGRAILLHPLVCPAFNADFDGDQMAVHVPLSIEAQSEARILMMASHNLLSPATSQPITLPSQDMVLGCYFLTADAKIYQDGFYSSFDEVLQSYDARKIGLHTWIWVNWDKPFSAWSQEITPIEIRIHSKGFRIELYRGSIRIFGKNGILLRQYIKTTTGRILWNQAIYDIFQSTF